MHSKSSHLDQGVFVKRGRMSHHSVGPVHDAIEVRADAVNRIHNDPFCASRKGSMSDPMSDEVPSSLRRCSNAMQNSMHKVVCLVFDRVASKRA